MKFQLFLLNYILKAQKGAHHFLSWFPQETDPLPDFPGTATLLQCSPMSCQVNFCLLWALAHTCCTDTCAHTDTLSAFPYFFEFMLKINNLGQKGWDLFLVANHLLTLLWQLLCYPGNLSICLPYKTQKELSQDLLPQKKPDQTITTPSQT